MHTLSKLPSFLTGGSQYPLVDASRADSALTRFVSIAHQELSRNEDDGVFGIDEVS